MAIAISFISVVVTGESKNNGDLKRRSSSLSVPSSSKVYGLIISDFQMLKHSSGDLVRDHFTSQESIKKSVSPESKTDTDSGDKDLKVSSINGSNDLLNVSPVESQQSVINPLQTAVSSVTALEADVAPHKNAAETTVCESPETQAQNEEVSSPSNHVKITFLSDSDSSGSSESSSSEDEDEKRIREERRRKEEAESVRIQAENEKNLLEEERRKKMRTSFFDESESSSSSDDRNTQETPATTQKSVAEVTSPGSEHRAGTPSTPQQSPLVESSSSSDDSSSSSSSESEEEQPLPTSMGMLSSLLHSSTPVVKESTTTKKAPSKPQFLTSSGPSRSFKNIYKEFVVVASLNIVVTKRRRLKYRLLFFLWQQMFQRDIRNDSNGKQSK